MDENDSIQLFEDRKIRTVWDEEREEWYFSVQDVVAVLSESTDPKQYIKKMRSPCRFRPDARRCLSGRP